MRKSYKQIKIKQQGVKVSCKNGLYRSSLDFLSSLAKIVVLINIIVIAMATCTAWLDIPSLHLQRWLSPLAITLRVGSVFFLKILFVQLCIHLLIYFFLFSCIQLEYIFIYLYVKISFSRHWKVMMVIYVQKTVMVLQP